KNFLLFFFVTITALPFNAFSDENKQAYQVSQEVYSSFMSPFCPGVSLKDCPSQEAEELRKEIYLKAKEGKSAEELLNDLVKRYGEQYLLVPQAKGIGILAWVMPLIFLFGGVIVITKLLRKK
ncbi:MAG: hypothetical protein D6780_01020, partial [Candidatus Dadabacteria bacterium]